MTVFLAVPTREAVVGQVAEELFKLGDRLDTVPRFVTGKLSAGETRSRIVAEFLASDADVLLMVDDDVMPSNRVPELVGRVEEWPVLAAAVPVFHDSWPKPAFAAFRSTPNGYAPKEPAHRGERVVECDAVGTGCIRIARAVLERIPDGFQSVSEDLAFCEAARAEGFRVGCDFWVVCDHLARVSLLRAMTAHNQ